MHSARPLARRRLRQRALLIALVLRVLLAVPQHADASVIGRMPAARDGTPWVVPTRPPACAAMQIASGDVGGCLLSSSDEPDNYGWPTPPFPSATPEGPGIVPFPGWTFNGFGYNGSLALASFEANMVANQTPIGPLPAGALKSMPEALPLFEGFLRDIIAGGYRVRDAGTYSFRCTSSSTRNCAGVSHYALSRHAWAIAIDLNSGANPEQTYTGVGGASACATPMVTDFPRWVIQTAEKWGLYWGGYGYAASGCFSPSQVKASTSRDATHFEFNGTPTMARAIAAHNLGGRCIDTVDDAGTPARQCLLPGEVPGKGWRVVVHTNPPSGATAALVNLTITEARGSGYITAEGCGAMPPGGRSSSNGNAAPGQDVANLAVVPLDADGRFCLYRSQPMHTVVDVEGFFTPTATAGANGALFTPLPPQRVMDTRLSAYCLPDGGPCAHTGSVPAQREVAVDVPAVSPDAVAVLANLTVTEPTGRGHLTADRCTALVPGAETHSNANFDPGQTIANLAVVPMASGGERRFCSFATAESHDVVDVQGYFAPATPSGWGFTSMPAQRLLDTRGCWTPTDGSTPRCGQINGTGDVLRLSAPAGATAVLVNLTLTDASASGFAVAAACSVITSTPSSNGNVARGSIAANLAVVPTDGDGSFCVRVSAPMHVVVDLQGTFSPNGALGLSAVDPTRVSDTRGT